VPLVRTQRQLQGEARTRKRPPSREPYAGAEVLGAAAQLPESHSLFSEASLTRSLGHILSK